MATEAGQFSSVIPSGPKTGVIDFPRLVSMDLSVFWLLNVPSTPSELKNDRIITAATITLPALKRKSFKRVQV